MSGAKEILTSWRVLILIFFILGSVVAISPKFDTKGVVINSVDFNSSAEQNGVQQGLIISQVNDQPVETLENYTSIINTIGPGDKVSISTDKGDFSFIAESKDNITSLGIIVDKVPKTNIKQGLDLVGGVRVLLQPEGELTQQQINDAIDITQRRLNIFGLSDISVKQVSDLEGNRFILIEMAGATEAQATKIVSQQGKFEAKIGNETVFVGGTDIKQVCRSAECSGVRTCNQVEDGWACQFEFRVDVSPESAKKHADITRNLGVITVGNQVYLEQKLDLYLDDELVDSLFISESLRGIESPSFVIQGPGSGATEEAAQLAALTNMKEMQTLLITGALPVKLNIVKTDIVSPTLGEQFLRYAILSILAAVVAVGAIIFLRYRNIKIASMVFLTGVAEVVIILGVAALIKWNLDLAAIAAIIAAVGTGVDAQIVITDEILAGEKSSRGWKERIKRAFFVIFGSYATVLAAMLPLWVLGATLLKGFAIVTILGVSIGVFITRPAYAKIIEVLLK